MILILFQFLIPHLLTIVPSVEAVYIVILALCTFLTVHLITIYLLSVAAEYTQEVEE